MVCQRSCHISLGVRYFGFSFQPLAPEPSGWSLFWCPVMSSVFVERRPARGRVREAPRLGDDRLSPIGARREGDWKPDGDFSGEPRPPAALRAEPGCANSGAPARRTRADMFAAHAEGPSNRRRGRLPKKPSGGSG